MIQFTNGTISLNNTDPLTREKKRSHGTLWFENLLPSLQFNKPNPMAKKQNLFLVH